MSDKINWTDEQLAAINAEGRAVLVSAAAGSGKTAVLVERLTRMLTDTENPVPADSIVVVTFTKDAAAQMKTKLANALSERLCADGITEEEAAHISSQLALIPSANISTIHSYCFRLIRENSGLSGVDPAFAIAEPDDEKNIILKAAENAFEEFIKKSPEKMKALTDFFCGGEKNIDSLTGIILMLREKYLTLPFPEEKMDGLVKFYKENSAVLSPDKGITGEYVKFAAQQLENAAEAARSLSAYITDIKENLPEREKENAKLIKNITAAAETVNDDYSVLKKLSEALTGEVSEIFAGGKKTCSLFAPSEPIEAGREKTDKNGNVSYSGKTVPAIKFERDGEETDVSKNIKEVRKLYYREASDFYEFENTGASAPKGTPMRFTEEQIKSDYRIHGEILELLFSLLKSVIKREKALKAERNVLGFSDAEQLACGILCRREGEKILPSEQAKNIADGISLVMIDEFQDSTQIQQLIFRMLSKGGSAQAPGSNFFAVGDVKQSIYRFRSAEPRIFLESLKESVPYDGEGDAPAHILLRRNFRSSRPVVDFVNGFFTAVMSESRGGVDYGEADSLVCTREPSDEKEYPTEIIEITDKFTAAVSAKKDEKEEIGGFAEAEGENENGNSGSTPKKLASEDFAYAEGTAAAKRIKEIIAENPKARLSDFCILSRYGKFFPVYERALSEAGLPCVSPAETDLLQRGETLAVINLLRALDNPWKDVPLMCAMMSPLFMFTAEEMARIRLLGKEGGGSLYGRIACAALWEESETDFSDDEKAVSAAVKIRCREFLEKFGRLREFALTHTSREMILHIYEELGYWAAAARSEGGREKTRSLAALDSAAANADKSGDGSVSSFVRRADALQRSGSGMPVQTALGGDAVIIQTVHKSKGLEYPYVFLCGNARPMQGGNSGNVCFYPSAGAGLDITAALKSGNGTNERLRYKTLPSCTIRAMNKKSERDEDMMLLYVALTRARERLFITRLRGSGESTSSIVSEILSKGAGLLGEKKRDSARAAQNSLADIIASGLCGGEFEASEDILHYDPNRNVLRINIPDPAGVEISEKNENAGTGSEPPPESIDEGIYRAVGKLLEESSKISYEPVRAKLTVSQIAKKNAGDIESEQTLSPVFGEFSGAQDNGDLPFEMTEGFFPEIDGYDPFGGSEEDEAVIRPVSGKITAADRGNAYHAFMQQADFHKLHAAGDKAEAVKEEIAVLAHKGIFTKAQADCLAPSVIGKFAESSLFLRMMKKGEFMRERKFLVKISDLGLDDSGLKVYTNTEGMLQGVADLIFREENGYVLCDYKTDRTLIPGVLVNRYKQQLRLYAAAFSLILDAPVKEAFIYSFALGEEIRVKL